MGASIKGPSSSDTGAPMHSSVSDESLETMVRRPVDPE